MPLPTLSRRQKAGLACALALLLWVNTGISHGDHTMLTGHSTFYNGEAYDPCLGSIAGIMRHRVMWFNDQVLVETYGGRGTYIFVTEHNAPDPRERRLFSEGVYYDFVDPNGAHWHVEEAFVLEDFTRTEKVDPNVDKVLTEQGYSPYSTTIQQNRTYVWFVAIAPKPIFDEFAGDDPHSYYNFLLLADTCKMRRTASFDGIENHDSADELNDRNGHPSNATQHTHERHVVDLWIGKRPVTTPFGAASTESTVWESSWAASWGESQLSSTNTTRETADGPNNQSPWNESRAE